MNSAIENSNTTHSYVLYFQFINSSVKNKSELDFQRYMGSDFLNLIHYYLYYLDVVYFYYYYRPCEIMNPKTSIAILLMIGLVRPFR
jgi:hypothetical protein